MRNPWLDLDLRSSSDSRYVHPADEAVVQAYSAKRRGPEYGLATHLLPEPWVGRLNAPVVMLLDNPGLSDHESDPHWTPSDALRHRAQASLRQKRLDHPYYWLDDEVSDTEGYGVAVDRLKRVIADVGPEAVGTNLVTLSAHPYHSCSFDDRLRTLPSQRFSVAALRRAIANDALVVILRARKYWYTAVPELEQHDIRGRVLRSNSPQNVTITPRNLDDYDALCKALTAPRR